MSNLAGGMYVGALSPLAELQQRQAGTMLLAVVPPPLTMERTWSWVRGAFAVPLLLQ